MDRSVPSVASVRIGTSAPSTPMVAIRDVWNRSRSSKRKSATRTATIVAERMISGARAWKSKCGDIALSSDRPGHAVGDIGHRAVGDAKHEVRVHAERDDEQ